MAIISAADAKYFSFLQKCISQAKIFHPRDKVTVYDLGLSDHQIKELNVDRIIPWKNVRIKGINKKFDIINAQKPHLIMEALEHYQENILFLDADAFLLKPVPELLYGNYDAVVTIRREEDQEFKFNKCRVLNGGVLSVSNRKFLEEWINTIKALDETYLPEQTALTRLVFSEHNFRVKKLPCLKYNFYWQDVPIPDNVRVFHYKGRKIKDGINWSL